MKYRREQENEMGLGRLRDIRLHCGIGGGRKGKERIESVGKERRGTGRSECCVNPFFRMVEVGKGGFFLPGILSRLRVR